MNFLFYAGGSIGFTVRAIFNFGFGELALVSPKANHLGPEARAVMAVFGSALRKMGSTDFLGNNQKKLPKKCKPNCKRTGFFFRQSIK